MLGDVYLTFTDSHEPYTPVALPHTNSHLDATLAVSPPNLQEGLPFTGWPNTTCEPEASTPRQLWET